MDHACVSEDGFTVAAVFQMLRSFSDAFFWCFDGKDCTHINK